MTGLVADALDKRTDAVAYGLALNGGFSRAGWADVAHPGDYVRVTDAGILLHTVCRCTSSSGTLSFWPRCFRRIHVLGIVPLQEAS